MLRNEELVDELIATLHFRKYFHLGRASILPDSPLNLVARPERINIIQDYIDDLFIDLFLRTYSFKPILVPKEWNVPYFSKDGENNSTNGYELNISNPFDRYTFVNVVEESILNQYGEWGKIFSKNSLINQTFFHDKKIGPIWYCPLAENNIHDYLTDEFEQYLNFMYGGNHYKYNPEYRALDLIQYSELYWEYFKSNCYKHVSLRYLFEKEKLMKDYIDIKDIWVFDGYTFEDILIIYCLLVYKFKLDDHNLLSFIGLFLKDSNCTILNEFIKFENQTTDVEYVKKFVRDRDLFLRFTSANKSKAVKFHLHENGAAGIQFFNETPIQTIYKNNSLPLPFLHKELYY